MLVQAGLTEISAESFLVRDLGFGQDRFTKGATEVQIVISASELEDAIAAQVDEFIVETVEEADRGVLEADYQWVVDRATGRTFASLWASDPLFVCRLVQEFLLHELLVGLFVHSTNATQVIVGADSVVCLGERIAIQAKATAVAQPEL